MDTTTRTAASTTGPPRTVLYRRPTYSIDDGLVGGLTGGVLMGMFSMVLFPLVGAGGFWQPMNLIGAVVDQSLGTVAGFAVMPSLVGMTIHLMMSAGLGAAFAWSAGRSGWHATAHVIVGAVLVGLTISALAYFFALPIVNPVMAIVFPLWIFALAHVAYGMGLGGYLAARGRQASEPERLATPPAVDAEVRTANGAGANGGTPLRRAA